MKFLHHLFGAIMQSNYHPNQTSHNAGLTGYSSQPPMPYNYNTGTPPNPSIYNGGGDVTYVNKFFFCYLLFQFRCAEIGL